MREGSLYPSKKIMVEEIIHKLVGIELLVNYLVKAGLYDLNKISEDYFCEFLNILYDLELENLNNGEANYPGIDLGDKNKRIAIQVTSTKTSKKVKNTIQMFIKRKYYEDFDSLKMLIIGEKTNFQKEFDTNGMFRFNHKKDVIDINDIVSDVSKAKEDTLIRLTEYLKRSHSYYYSKKALNTTEKVNEKVHEDFISRKWISKEKKIINDKIFGIYRNEYYESVLKVFKENSRVVVLNDAGHGKTLEAKHFVNKINKNSKLN